MKTLFQAAAELQQFFSEQGWPFCFIGGIALQRWGEPRLTVDIDVSLLTGFGNEETYVDLLCRVYSPRVPDARAFALQNRVLLLTLAQRIPVDIALTGLPFEERVIHRATDHPFLETIRLRTCSAEDLIVLKAFADRPRDWADIEGILIRQRKTLDRAYVVEQLRPLCELKEQPEIVDRLLRLMSQVVGS